jgi:radical SAM protein with 4Fe4S-binding SPASM domain
VTWFSNGGVTGLESVVMSNAQKKHPSSGPPRIASCAFELTLRCNARCLHCGSDAKEERAEELSTGEALQVIRDVAALGCKRFTFSGGEPFLRRDWPALADAVNAEGMRLEAITNGLLVAEQADLIRAAGFFTVGFSVDGPEEIHDAIRGVRGGLRRLLEGARAISGRGARIGAVTQINRRNAGHLDDILDLLLENRFEGWQLQLTMPHGRAGANSGALCLDPEELPALEEKAVQLIERSPIPVLCADNFGYFGRREPLFRGVGERVSLWGGCAAGLSNIGITSDGTVRGCLSLPPSLDEGNLRERPLEAIWRDPDAFAYNRRFSPGDLTGTCRGCALGHICRGGCKSLAMAVTGTTTCNPHCLRRLAD